MTGWLHDLPLAGLALVVFSLTFLATAIVYVVVMRLAVGRWGEAFKGLSPGMLPPMGLLFGLIVGFLAPRSGPTPGERRMRWTARRAPSGRWCCWFRPSRASRRPVWTG
jgi:uncharacterized RDD family membrane protein YckC